MLSQSPRAICHQVSLVFASLILSGCGQAPPQLAEAPPAGSPSLTSTSSAETDNASSKVKTSPHPVAHRPAPEPYTDVSYLPDDLIGLIVVHPRRIIEWPLYQMIQEAGLLSDVTRQLGAFDIKLDAIERVSVVIDKSTFESEFAIEDRNHLRQLSLGMFNYHDNFQGFPRADGSADGKSTGLSWRVHLLPYLEQADLYEQFHLDEPWDSEHNKSLIEKMPAIYSTPGVSEAGKTSLHVFVGEQTPFHGDKGTTLSEITDGGSNTILAVMAGPSAAEFWTKPGGLEFEVQSPRKSLGDVGDKFFAILADGAVVRLPGDIDDKTLANLIQSSDGNSVPNHWDDLNKPRPTAIVTLTGVADQSAILKALLTETREETHEDQVLYTSHASSLAFIDDKTVLSGTPQAVKKLISTNRASKKASSSNEPALVKSINGSADLAIAIDLKAQPQLFDQVAEANPLVAGILTQLETISLQLNPTGQAGDKLIQIQVASSHEAVAEILAQQAKGAVQQGKMLLSMTPPPGPGEQAAHEILAKIVQSAEVSRQGTSIEFQVPVPDDFDKLPDLLRPALSRFAQVTAQTRALNNLQQIGTALFSYQGTHKVFPGAGRSADGQEGLSWRVHLLPYLGESALYDQFDLQQPWDSEANKNLISKMPDVFRSRGVPEAGKTSMHVFTGAGSPFADNQAPDPESFKDDRSGIILVVEAGADKADYWTKPGGLAFDPMNPLTSLGTLSEFFNVVLADTTARPISRKVPPATLRKLIQSSDGEPLEEF